MNAGVSRPKVLTAAFVRTINRAGRYGDGRGGHGLSLLVKPTMNGRWSKTWAQRLRIGGRPVSLGLGSYPAVSLALARERALANRQAVEEGRDPRRRHAVTFSDAMAAVIELHRPNWKPTSDTERQWRSLLATHIDPTIGAMPIAQVAAADVVAVLDRVWDRPELARRTARRISATMRWAMGRGLREADPTAAAVAAMPKLRHRPNHRRALHHSDLADALKTVRASQAADTTKAAIELLALTATRPGEVRCATWVEFDLDAAVWTIPAARYKTGVEFRVPLSTRAVEVLREARDSDGGGRALTEARDSSGGGALAEARDGSDGLVFPSAVTGRAVSVNTYVKLLRELGIATSAHGLRATFRSWCSDAGVPRDLAEMALGHVVAGTEGAYARSDMLERRRTLMQQWSDYIA